jgi:hypothetical protein
MIMDMNTPTIIKLRHLLAAVSGHGKQHLLRVEADLLQTTYLLNKAIEDLSASFISVHDSVTKQQQILDSLIEQHHFNHEETNQLEVFKQNIVNEVNAVITGLQFQDLTSQLLTRTVNHVNGLKDLLQELVTHDDAVIQGTEQEQLISFLEEVDRKLHASSHNLAAGSRPSVKSKDMATGDIELF